RHIEHFHIALKSVSDKNLYKEVLFNRRDNRTDSTITINGNPVSDTATHCNLINEEFCTAGEKLTTAIISHNGYDIVDKNVNAHDVVKVIEELPNKKSNGIEKVPIQLLEGN